MTARFEGPGGLECQKTFFLSQRHEFETTQVQNVCLKKHPILGFLCYFLTPTPFLPLAFVIFQALGLESNTKSLWAINKSLRLRESFFRDKAHFWSFCVCL